MALHKRLAWRRPSPLAFVNSRGDMSLVAAAFCRLPRGCLFPPRLTTPACCALRNSSRGFVSASAIRSTRRRDGERKQLPSGAAGDDVERRAAERRWGVAGAGGGGLREIEEELSALRHNILRHCDDTFKLLPPVDYRQPMVMLLGNHSAGKSTIINHLLGREVQRTGVAPTDDGFTVIQRGGEDADEDGPTGLSNPHHQLQDLQKFGMHFVHRFRVKTRRLPSTSRVPGGMMIVDTPGMIDTPVHVTDRTTLEGQLRGYDFLAVTRWFAVRCDVILLVFDPANPGTTGETLDVLTKSLAGFEHKFLLVMNKVDMFDRATDFARAYGALCWNLSKVITMKDIPRIYTTFVPVTAAATGEVGTMSALSSTSSCARRAATTVPLYEDKVTVVATQEFVREREEVIDELLKAPLRRLDNLITEAEEGARRVLLAGRVCTAIVWKYRREQFTAVFVPSALLGVAMLLLSLAGITGTTLSLASLPIIAAGGALYKSITQLKKIEEELFNNSNAVVDRLFIGRENTLDLQLRWKNVVKPEILDLASSSAEAGRGVISSLPTLTRRGDKSIVSILNRDIPKLRLRVAEYKRMHYGLDNGQTSSSSFSEGH